MPAGLFSLQRAVAEELLAIGWHASSIAIATKPASAWVLFDPSRRIRVHMRCDLAQVAAEITTTALAGRSLKSRPWAMTVHHASVSALITALHAAPGASGNGTPRDQRTIIYALASAGMLPDRSRLARVLSGTAVWHSPGRDAEATWHAPHSRRTGGWQILTAAAHVDATPGAPAAALVPLITAPCHTPDETDQP